MFRNLTGILKLFVPPIVVLAFKKFIKEDPNRNRPCLELSHVNGLHRLVPELSNFDFEVTEATAASLLNFYNHYIPLIRPESRNAYVRSLLAELANNSPDLAGKSKDLIAALDLADGLPDRARRLASDPKFAMELKKEITEAETAYGAPYISSDWGNPSRGASILYYFQSNPELVKGKRVLHIAPEAETRDWLRSNSQYSVLDGVPDEGTDLAADIVNIPIPDQSVEVVICHRVLEHVLDDIGAMKEFYRILAPGGLLNLSVPQSSHKAVTKEWLVQDRSHHDHVRQYGLDLVERLSSVGFTADIENWLVQQPRNELMERTAFPLRMYNAWKHQ